METQRDSLGYRPSGPWRRVHKPSVGARILLVIMGSFLWLVLLVIAGTSISDGHGGYPAAAPLLALGQVLPGLLLRASRWQGVSINPGGDLLLSSAHSVTLIPRASVERLEIDPDTASFFVWSGGAVIWLEVGSRLGLGRARRETLERTAERLRQTLGVEVSLGRTAFDGGDRIVALEFKLAGFARVLRSSAVWVPVLLGQLLLLSALG